MKREDILKLAREQGLPETATEGLFIVNTDDLGRVLSAEREACAQVCDELANKASVKNGQQLALDLASDAIRARGEA